MSRASPLKGRYGRLGTVLSTPRPPIWIFFGEVVLSHQSAMPYFPSISSLLVLSFSCGLLSAQSVEIDAAPVLSARIIGGVSDGRPVPRVMKTPPLPRYKIRWSKASYDIHGRKTTINRVAPPVDAIPASATSAPALRAAATISNSKSAVEHQSSAVKYGGTFMVYATIDDHRTTRVRWQYDGEKYEAYSNIDFNHLNGFHSFEGRGKRYTMMLLTGNASRRDMGRKLDKGTRAGMVADLSKLPTLARRGPSYMLIKGDENNDGAMEFIEAIHDLYAAEQPRLRRAYEARKKNSIIQAKNQDSLRKNPPPKPDIIINYWKRHTPEASERGSRKPSNKQANTRRP